MFLDYACDPRYGWAAECQQRVGSVPVQVFHEGSYHLGTLRSFRPDSFPTHTMPIGV